jgi:hypothetical protein
MNNKWNIVIRSLIGMLIFMSLSYFVFYLGRVVYSPMIEEVEDVSYNNIPKSIILQENNKRAQLIEHTRSISLTRDPFFLEQKPIKSITKTPTATLLNLKGVMWEENNPQALINNEIVELGSSIENCTVADIQPGEVTLIKDDPNIHPDQRVIILKMPLPKT